MPNFQAVCLYLFSPIMSEAMILCARSLTLIGHRVPRCINGMTLPYRSCSALREDTLVADLGLQEHRLAKPTYSDL